MKHKKAQSISINTIVVAAIALLVLVVIIFIFGDRIQLFGQGARSCENQGGEGCFETCDPEDGSGPAEPGIYTALPGTSCNDLEPKGSFKCCKLIIPQEES